MNDLLLQQTMETTLAGAVTVPVIYENTGQTPPNDVYIEVQLRPVSNIRQVMGSNGPYKRNAGAFWMYVIDPLVRGTATAQTIADTLAAHFTSTTLNIGHGNAYMDVPQIQRLGRLAKGYTVAIRIDYWYYSDRGNT